MSDFTLPLVIAVFLLAGMVKGVIGLGLPTIAMGLLAVVMPPVQAAALLVMPSLVTNLLQMVWGPGLGPILRRLWPVMVTVCLGTWLGMGWIAQGGWWGTGLLGVALVAYAVLGLSPVRLRVPVRWEGVLGPLVGLATGMVTAATGVFVLPAVPYLQALGMEKETLIQALGLSFTVSTLALMVNLGVAGMLDPGRGVMVLLALIAACAGMGVGQVVRQRLSQAAFRRGFFGGLLLLGLYLAARAAFPHG